MIRSFFSWTIYHRRQRPNMQPAQNASFLTSTETDAMSPPNHPLLSLRCSQGIYFALSPPNPEHHRPDPFPPALQQRLRLANYPKRAFYLSSLLENYLSDSNPDQVSGFLFLLFSNSLSAKLVTNRFQSDPHPHLLFSQFLNIRVQSFSILPFSASSPSITFHSSINHIQLSSPSYHHFDPNPPLCSEMSSKARSSDGPQPTELHSFSLKDGDQRIRPVSEKSTDESFLKWKETIERNKARPECIACGMLVLPSHIDERIIARRGAEGRNVEWLQDEFPSKTSENPVFQKLALVNEEVIKIENALEVCNTSLLRHAITIGEILNLKSEPEPEEDLDRNERTRRNELTTFNILEKVSRLLYGLSIARKDERILPHAVQTEKMVEDYRTDLRMAQSFYICAHKDESHAESLTSSSGCCSVLHYQCFPGNLNAREAQFSCPGLLVQPTPQDKIGQYTMKQEEIIDVDLVQQKPLEDELEANMQRMAMQEQIGC